MRRSSFCIALILALPVLALAVTHQPSRVDQILDDFHNHHEKILVAAHRGAHQEHPENSLAAIEEAIRLGVDIVELDVRKTADGHLVLMHDSAVDRTTTGAGEVSRLSLKDLQGLRLRKGAAVTEYRVPTLAEALRVARDRIMVAIDLKVFSVTGLLRVIEETKTQRQVLISSSNSVFLMVMRWFNPGVMVMPRARSAADVGKLLRRVDTKIIHIDESFYARDLVEKIKRARIRIWINTLNSPDGLALRGDFAGYLRIVSGGANVLQTDHPELLQHYLKRAHEPPGGAPRLVPRRTQEPNPLTFARARRPSSYVSRDQSR